MEANKEQRRTLCLICNEPHESVMLHGMEFMACPKMPENMIMPQSTIEAFFAGRSMLDQPFIVITPQT